MLLCVFVANYCRILAYVFYSLNLSQHSNQFKYVSVIFRLSNCYSLTLTDMKTQYPLLLLIVLIAWGSCKEDQLIQANNCYPDIKDIRRTEHVVDFPVTYRTSGGLITGGRLDLSKGSNAWGACNLSDEFKKDSLDLFVTGYFLTSPDLEKMNINPVPFEVTSARLR